MKAPLLAILFLSLILSSSGFFDTAALPAAPTELFISEYIEGTSFNKALEIYNGSGAVIDLAAGAYDIQIYFNGSVSAGTTIPLTGSVDIGDVYVVAHASANVAILPQADQTNDSSWYNGNDAVALRKNGAIIDVIGQIGFDPGVEWGVGSASTQDNTVQRRSSTCQGDPNGTDVFYPAQEWTGLAIDTTAGLGAHAATCISAIGSCGDSAVPIHAIQGSGISSPYAGSEAVIEAVVVGDFQDTSNQLRGFFLQEEDSAVDADPATSEGIFVFDDGFGVDVSPGQVVRVMGAVTEYFGLTELSNISAVMVCSSDAVAPSVVTLPVTNISAWERWEGMLITLPQALYVTENYNLGRYGEVSLSLNGRLYAPTQIVAPGSLAVQQQDLNDRSRIQLDDGSNLQNPLPLPPYLGVDNTLRLGDSLPGLTGVLSYSYSSYEIHPTQSIFFTRVNSRLKEPPAMIEGSLTIVTTNLLNYFTTLDDNGPICGPTGTLYCRGANTAEEFTRQRAKILSAFMSMEPDIAGLIEIENNPTEAIQNLVDGLNNLFGAETYAYINTGTIGTDAIKVAIIYKPEKVAPLGSFRILDSSVDPNFMDTKNRPSLAQTFVTPAGAKFTVVVNHLKSKGSSCSDVGDPDISDGQGNCNLTRTNAVSALIDWLDTDPTGSGDADFLLLGDFNSYAKEDPIQVLKNAGYANLVESDKPPQPYSYTFEGQSGTLDYALASPSLAKQIGHGFELHVNTDEPSVLDYNDYNQPGLYTSEVYRYADHDPILLTINPWKEQLFLPLITR